MNFLTPSTFGVPKHSILPTIRTSSSAKNLLVQMWC